MSFWITLLLAIGIIALCLAGLGISKLLTGKSRLSCKRCSKPEEKEKGCSLCGKPPKKKK